MALVLALAGLSTLPADAIGASVRSCDRHNRSARMTATQTFAGWELFTLSALVPVQTPQPASRVCAIDVTPPRPMVLAPARRLCDSRAGLMNLPPPARA